MYSAYMYDMYMQVLEVYVCVWFKVLWFSAEYWRNGLQCMNIIGLDTPKNCPFISQQRGTVCANMADSYSAFNA